MECLIHSPAFKSRKMAWVAGLGEAEALFLRVWSARCSAPAVACAPCVLESRRSTPTTTRTSQTPGNLCVRPQSKTYVLLCRSPGARRRFARCSPSRARAREGEHLANRRRAPGDLHSSTYVLDCGRTHRFPGVWEVRVVVGVLRRDSRTHGAQATAGALQRALQTRKKSASASPSPATHAILRDLKAGECIRHSI